MKIETLLEILNAMEQMGPDQRLDTYFHSVLSTVSTHAGTEYAAIDLVDEILGDLRCVVESGTSGDAGADVVEDLQRSVLASRQALVKDRWVAAPLIAGDAVYGVIRLLRKSDPGDRVESIDLLAATIVAKLVASEMRNAQSHERRLHFEHLVYRSPDPMCVLDRHGRIQHFNQECERIWGITESDALGMLIDQFYESRESARAVGRAMRNSENQAIHDYPAAIKDRSGHIIPIRLSASLFLDAAGHVTGSVGVFKDDRANQQSQEDRVRGEKLAAIGRLSATTAHDMKHDMGALLGFLDVLEHVGSDDTQFARICSGMRAAASNSLAKLQNLVMTGQPSPPRRQIVSIQSLLTSFASTVRFQTEASHTVFVFDRPLYDVSVLVDPNQIRQLLMNLLGNSMDAIYMARAHGDRQWSKAGRITLSVAVTKDTVILSWHDNGCGMSADVRRKAFTPFFTTKANGSGLGLYLCRLIAESHDGKIVVVEPPEGEGSAFRITLRRAEAH